jgi:thioredoxin-like negative regulator of GroEL
LRRNFDGFKGDRKFIQDDQAQKAFSKLRSAIGGIYFWRINDSNNQNPQVRERMIKEADFAFRQAFAFCPYSPESISHYVTLLANQQRFDDALLISRTCSKLDPYNSWFRDLTRRIEQWQKDNDSAQGKLRQLQRTVQEHPEDFQAAFDLAVVYLQAQQAPLALQVLDRVLNHPMAEATALRALLQAYTSLGNPPGKIQAVVDKVKIIVNAAPTNSQAVIALAEGYNDLQNTNAASQVLDQLLENPNADSTAMLLLARQYVAMGNYQKVEVALERVTRLRSDSPEAWYDYAALKAFLGKSTESFQALRQSFSLSTARSKQDPKARDLYVEIQTDQRFDSLRNMAEFMQLTNRAK